MINASNEFKHLLLGEDRHDYLEYADITLTDGTELHLTNSDFWQGGMEIEDAVSSDSSFDVGASIINKCTLVIENLDERFSEYEFTGAEVVPYIGLELSDGTVEKIRKGTFNVDEPKYNGSIITLSCLDHMAKFDRNYSDSKLSYPASLMSIVQDACTVCSVSLQTVKFPHDDFVIQTRPTDEAITFREVIAWVAQIAGCFARCDTLGRLELKWYDQKALESPVIVDWSKKNPENESNENAHWIHSNYSSPVVSLDDVVITGVRVVEKNESDDSKEDLVTYQTGKDGYVVSIEENELIKNGAGNTVVGWLGEQLIGVRFRKAQASHASNPLMEAGDIAVLTDRKGNNYNLPVSYTKFSTGSAQNTESRAQEPARNSAARFSAQTKNYVEWRKAVQQEKTQRELAIQGLSERLNNVSGVYTTVEQAEGGGSVFYLHNKPQLEESDMVWKMTAEAWGVSTDGMDTWNAGMTVDGNTIVRILTAVGVNADWINTGRIEVKDDNGETVFLVDMGTKQVIIAGDSVRIGGKPAAQALADNLAEAKNYSDGNLSDYADIVTKNFANVQKQLDGQIESFFENYEPTMENKPAADWTTEEQRLSHEGDIFYWEKEDGTSYAYRFMKDASTSKWGWNLIQDTDITKAIADAAHAQDTADGKRRNFVITPYTPYDIGDQWTDSDTGEVYTCKTARAAGSPYVSSDWEKLNKYTDDTVANQALEEAKKAHNLTIILDNEYEGIPTDSEGNYSGTLKAQTVVQTYYGQQNVSASCTYTTQKSDGVTGSWNDAARTYTVTGLSTDAGWVDITASYMGIFTVTKRFNVAKVKAGARGTSGSNGVGISGSTVTYQKSTDGVNPPETWQASIPPTSAGEYLWTKTVTNYTDGKSTTTYSVSRNGLTGAAGKDGEPGEDGAPGAPGKDGVSTYTHIRYSAKADGEGFVATPSATTIYIGVYTGTSASAPAAKTSYQWSKYKGDKGDTGTAGKAGNGISSITYYYAVNNSATTPAATAVTGTSLNTVIGTMSPTNRYLWQKEVIDFTDTSVDDKTTVTLLAVYGNTGATGKDGTNGTNGKDGTSITIKSTSITYQESSSGTVIPTSTWGSDVPDVPLGHYLWTKTVVNYSDGTSTTSYSVAYKGTNGSNGKDGKDGKGISSTSVTYQTSSSGGPNPPTGEWKPTVQTASAGQYLWTKTEITYTDNSKSTMYAVSRNGSNGANGAAGKGIQSITNYYLATSSGSNVTENTQGWSTNPATQTLTAANKYLWNYEVTMYTDGGSSTIAPHIIGVYGDKGATGGTGAAGAAGKGIQSIVEYYTTSTGTTAPDDSAFKTGTPPAMTEANKYLWNYELITYTDNSTHKSDKRIIGAFGDTGATGAPGKDGSPGKDGAAGRTYFMEPSTLIVKRSANNAMAPNYITLSAYYRDGTSTARTAYSGRFKIEESLDGDKWTTVYTSTANEATVTHSLYGALATSAGGAISSAANKTIGIPRDVVAIRCTLYAAGGTTQMLDMQTVAVVIDVDALTHEEILDLLTNNGEMKGIYQEGNQLYISFTYAKGGALTLGGASNGNGRLSIRNASNAEVGYIDNTGGHFNQGSFSGQLSAASGTFSGTVSAGAVTGSTISGSTISGSTFTTTGSNANNKIVLQNSQMAIYANGDYDKFAGRIEPEIIDATIDLGGGVLSEERVAGICINSNHIFRVLVGGAEQIESYKGRTFISGLLFVDGIETQGKKSRIARTENYQDRLLYCYEMPSPMFGDIGEAVTDEDGECYIYLDDIFSETVSAQIEYQVFLQKEGAGDLWVDSKEPAFFVVKGTPGLKFSWEVKAKQRDYEYERLDEYQAFPENEEIDYEQQYIDEIKELINAEEEILYETA